MINSLFTHVYGRIQSGISYSYSLFHRKDSQEDLLKKIEIIEKNLFSQISTLTSKVEETQNYLEEALDNLAKSRERESISKCYNYLKKIGDLLTDISISFSKISPSHKCSSTYRECIYTIHLKGCKESLLKVQRYIQLTIPHANNLRDLDIKRKVIKMLRENSVQEGLDILASLKLEEKSYVYKTEESCNKICESVDKFKKVFTNISEEVDKIASHLDEYTQ